MSEHGFLSTFGASLKPHDRRRSGERLQEEEGETCARSPFLLLLPSLKGIPKWRVHRDRDRPFIFIGHNPFVPLPPPPSLSLSLSHCHSCPVIGSSRRNSSLQGSKLQWKPDADQARASARSLSAAGRDFVNSSKTKIRVNLISLNEVPIVKSRAAASAGAAPWNKKDKEGVNRRKTRRTRLPLWG